MNQSIHEWIDLSLLSWGRQVLFGPHPLALSLQGWWGKNVVSCVGKGREAGKMSPVRRAGEEETQVRRVLSQAVGPQDPWQELKVPETLATSLVYFNNWKKVCIDFLLGNGHWLCPIAADTKDMTFDTNGLGPGASHFCLVAAIQSLGFNQ